MEKMAIPKQPASPEENEYFLLLHLSREISACRTREDIQHIVTNSLSKYFQFNEIMICLNNEDNQTHSNYIHTISAETMNHPDFARGAAMKYYIRDGIYSVIQEADEYIRFDMHELMGRRDRPYYVDFFYENRVKELIGFPVRVNNESFGAVFVYVKEKRKFSPEQLSLAKAVCSLISTAISNVKANEKIRAQIEEIKDLKNRLEQENQYLQEQIRKSETEGEIIGAGNGLKNIFNLVSIVASSDSTVLILGETGTGKELIARSIHQYSSRKDKIMVKVNCSAIPAHLIESELFGHEKGSFTGATERRIGKFELAQNSTLLLDEIGEMTSELQVKLLRALQEREIERVGGKGPIKINVRIIAATNRDLHKEVEAGRFRSDLYYRLNVFPLRIPPLRERPEDIPKLVSFFIKRFAMRFGKKITHTSPKVLEELMQYHWPGNVRELEHVMERSILMSSGSVVTEVFLPQKNQLPITSPEDTVIKSLFENEKEHILSALKKSNGRIRGAGGASEILKIPPTTLHSRMKKLGIQKTVN